MNRFLRTLLLSLSLALLLAPPALATSLNEAAQRVARQYDARVLSANTIERGGERIHVIRILTNDGVVRSVEVPAGRTADRRQERDQRFDRGRDRDRDRSRDRRHEDTSRDRGRERPRDADRSAPRERRGRR